MSAVDHPDWKIIVAFYAALHYVEAVLAGKNIHSTDHKSRNQYMRTVAELQPARADYESLASYAWTARYDPRVDFSRQVQAVCDLLIEIKRSLGQVN